MSTGTRRLLIACAALAAIAAAVATARAQAPPHAAKTTLAAAVSAPAVLHPARTLALDLGRRFAVSPDGKLLAGVTVRRTGPPTHAIIRDTVHLWRLADGKLLRQWETGYRFCVFVGFSPDGRTLVTSTPKDRIALHLWRVADGKLLRNFDCRTNVLIVQAAFSPDGRLLACGRGVFRVDDGRLLYTFGNAASGLAVFSPDGRTIGTTGPGWTIQLWSAADGAPIRTLPGKTRQPVQSLAFSPNGKLLASGAADHRVRLWRVEDGALLDTLAGHWAPVDALCFRPDGGVLASASASWEDPANTVVKLWSVPGGRLLASLPGAQGPVDFVGAGDVLVTSLPDWSVALWRVGAVLRTQQARR